MRDDRDEELEEISEEDIFDDEFVELLDQEYQKLMFYCCRKIDFLETFVAGLSIFTTTLMIAVYFLLAKLIF